MIVVYQPIIRWCCYAESYDERIYVDAYKSAGAAARAAKHFECRIEYVIVRYVSTLTSKEISSQGGTGSKRHRVPRGKEARCPTS